MTYFIIKLVLIDGIGAPGMSGGPVFIERNQKLILYGIYTGLIYPDYDINQLRSVVTNI
jgi:hypothetical protein